MTAPVRVVLADDQQLIRTALSMVLAELDDVEVVGEAATGRRRCGSSPNSPRTSW